MTVRVIKGDVRERLPELPADFFDCIVTSPPYFGLRSYLPDEHRDKHREIGLQPTLDAYLETMVAVCRELRRVLKPSGICFINIGDSYSGANGTRGGNANGTGKTGLKRDGRNEVSRLASAAKTKTIGMNSVSCETGLKPKDLCLVPERLGIMLQADGWWVRSHIIWAKKNCMPESVTDRPTSAHETIWMLTKAERYFWDAEAVREPINPNNKGECSVVEGSGGTAVDGNEKPVGAIRKYAEIKGANIRNVFSVASYPFPGAHFATMPPEIAERCIKAGSSEKGCCAECGAPWVRIVERRSPPEYQGGKAAELRATGVSNNRTASGPSGNGLGVQPTKILGWESSCNCQTAATAPARILDPFAGAGTTGLVADRLGRDATLIDLNTCYAEMALNRIVDDAPLFAEVAAE